MTLPRLNINYIQQYAYAAPRWNMKACYTMGSSKRWLIGLADCTHNIPFPKDWLCAPLFKICPRGNHLPQQLFGGKVCGPATFGLGQHLRFCVTFFIWFLLSRINPASVDSKIHNIVVRGVSWILCNPKRNPRNRLRNRSLILFSFQNQVILTHTISIT